MAKLASKTVVQANITIALSEEEAAALDALAGYGTDSFLKVFYEHIGSAYLKPHEKGLRTLFESVRNNESGVQFFLRRFNDARAVFDGEKEAVAIKRS